MAKEDEDIITMDEGKQEEAGYLPEDWQDRLKVYGQVMEQCITEANRCVDLGRFVQLMEGEYGKGMALALFNAVTKYDAAAAMTGTLQKFIEQWQEDQNQKPSGVTFLSRYPPPPRGCQHSYLRAIEAPEMWSEPQKFMVEKLVTEHGRVECPECHELFAVEDVESGAIWRPEESEESEGKEREP